MSRDMYTLDQIVAEALRDHERPRFRESDHVGVRADPPTVRVKPRPDGTWSILDVDRPLAGAPDLDSALAQATALLGNVVGNSGG